MSSICVLGVCSSVYWKQPKFALSCSYFNKDVGLPHNKLIYETTTAYYTKKISTTDRQDYFPALTPLFSLGLTWNVS